MGQRLLAGDLVSPSVGGSGCPAFAAAASKAHAGKILDDPDPLGLDACVLQAQGKLGRPGARARRQAHAPGQQLEVRIPDPRHIVAVGGVVVEHSKQVVGPGSSASVRSTSFAPAGFLTSRMRVSRPATVTVSARPKAALVLSRPATMSASDIPKATPRAAAASAL